MRLRAVDLAAVRGGRRVFAGANFSIEPGRTAALRGPNGSGKSTLLRTLAGLTRPAKGEVWAGDASSARDLDLVQERIAFLGHTDAAKPALSPRETLAFWAGWFDTPTLEIAPKVEAALERFDLGDAADEPTGRLSAGQRRRVGLARLLLLDRPIWLLDEPTTALDAQATRILTETLDAHSARGGVALFAVHGAAPAREDQILDMAAFKPKEADLGDPFLDGFETEPTQ